VCLFINFPSNALSFVHRHHRFCCWKGIMAVLRHHAAQIELPEHGRRWQFLNITEPSQSRREGFQERVRSNAMRDHRRHERIKRTEAFAKAKRSDAATQMNRSSGKDSSAIPTKGNSMERGALRVCSAKCHLSRTIPRPQTHLGAGLVDPFETSPTNGRRDYYYLINHCKYLPCCLIIQQAHEGPISTPLPDLFSYNISRMALGPIAPNMYVTNPCCPISYPLICPSFPPY